MKLLVRHQALLLLTAGLIFLTNLGGHALLNDAEARTAATAAETFRRGAWLIPSFNDQPNTDAPILIHWLMGAAFRLLGISEFSARLAPALLAIGTVLLTYHLGRKLYASDVGLLGGLILATGPLFAGTGRAATTDSTLTFLITLSFTGYVWTTTRRRGSSFTRGDTPAVDDDEEFDEDEESAESIPSPSLVTRLKGLALRAYQNLLFVLLVYVPLGLGGLTDGPVAVILPCLTLLCFVLLSIRYDDLDSGRLDTPTGPAWRNAVVAVAQALRPLKVIAAGLEIHLVIGLAIVAGVALPWYLTVAGLTQGHWLKAYLMESNLGAALTARPGQSGIPFFALHTIVALHLGWFPWSAFLPVAAYQLRERLKYGAAWRESDRLLTCWTLVWLISYSLIASKSLTSLTPISPAIALILARYFTDWKRESASGGAYSFIICCRALWVAGVGVALMTCILAYLYFPSQQWLAGLGLIPVVGGFVALKFLEQERRQTAIRALVIAAALFTGGMVVIAPNQARAYQDTPQFIAAARGFAKSADVRIATYDYFEPSVTFYAGQPVTLLTTPRQVADFISSSPRAFVIYRVNRFNDNDLQATLSNGAIPLTRHKNFLHGRELALIGRKL